MPSVLSVPPGTGAAAAPVLRDVGVPGVFESVVVEEVVPLEGGQSSSGVNRTEADESTDRELILSRDALAAEEWTDALEDEFAHLASKEALGAFTPRERARLERLTACRRVSGYPLTGAEVLQHFRHMQLLHRVTEMLDECFTFHRPPPGRSGTAAEEAAD